MVSYKETIFQKNVSCKLTKRGIAIKMEKNFKKQKILWKITFIRNFLKSILSA